MLEHNDHEQNPFTGISNRLAEPLRQEVYNELTELGEMQMGGVIYSDSANKTARFIMNCNQDKIPMIFCII